MSIKIEGVYATYTIILGEVYVIFPIVFIEIVKK
jgi:hypothetical protein